MSSKRLDTPQIQALEAELKAQNEEAARAAEAFSKCADKAKGSVACDTKKFKLRRTHRGMNSAGPTDGSNNGTNGTNGTGGTNGTHQNGV